MCSDELERRAGQEGYIPCRGGHVAEVEDEPEESRSVLGRGRKRHPESEPHRFKSGLEREKVCNFPHLPAYGGLMDKGLVCQVVEKARGLFDVFNRLLGHVSFFLGAERCASPRYLLGMYLLTLKS